MLKVRLGHITKAILQTNYIFFTQAHNIKTHNGALYAVDVSDLTGQLGRTN